MVRAFGTHSGEPINDPVDVVGVLERILEQAQAKPGNPALEDLVLDLSYAQLVQEVGFLAGALAARGVDEGDRVCLHLPNSAEFVLAALACLWRGAIFVPLASTDPPARLGVILDDCSPRLVVTAGPGREVPGTGAAPGPWEWAEIGDLRSVRAAPLAPRLGDDALAYAIYTSGTTGSPKGVMIGRRAFAAAIASTAAACGNDERTRTLCVSPFHFDGSYGTMFPALYRGGSVVIRPRESLMFPRTFFNTVRQEKVTFAGFSPSYLRILLSDRQLATLQGSSLEGIAIGGEAISVHDLRSLWAALPSVRVFNRYGPTESTIAVSHVLLTPGSTKDGVIPVGRPHPGVDFHLFDPDGRPVEGPDRVGELCIGGIQLMEGYWKAPELTAAVMRTDLVPGRTLYRTGDLMYRTASGDYVYVGRTDDVIKRHGVRISLVELSESMRNLDGVMAAACTVFDNQGETGIVAFVVTTGEMSDLELRERAGARLPISMLPDRVVVVAGMPLTASGKLDERALLAAAGLAPLGR